MKAKKMRADIVLKDVAILKMSSEDLKRLALYRPKEVYLCLETSGSPSCWTNDGELLMGTTGEAVLMCAKHIIKMAELCDAYNENASGDNYRTFKGYIRIVF